MKKRYIILIVVIGFFTFIGYFGGCEFSSASISNPKICTSLDGSLCASDNSVINGNPAEIFLSCNLKYAPDNTDVKFTWYYYGTTKFEIGNYTKNSGVEGSFLDLQASLTIPTSGSWPRGNYEVVIQIMVEGKDPVVKSFQIQ